MTTKQAFAVCALALWTLTAGAGVAPLPTYWGVIVELDEASEPTAKQLAKTLRDSYGFESDHVFELYGDDATSKGVLELMDQVYERVAAGDFLFVHLSLPVSDRGTAFFQVADSNPGEPWTSLTLEVVLSWLGALPAETVLFTYPSAYAPCDTTGSGRLQSEQTGRLAYGRAGVYELLRSCDLSAAPANTDPTERMRRITSTLATVLDQRASMSPTQIQSVELARRLGDAAGGGISFWIETAPLGADPRFFFSPVSPEFALYQSRYQSAETSQERQDVLKSLTGAALKDARGLGERASEYLADIALSDRAGLGDQLPAQDALGLRLLAVDGLSQLAPSVREARTKTIDVAQGADHEAVRQLAVTKISVIEGPDEQRALRDIIENDTSDNVRIAALRGVVLLEDTSAGEEIADVIRDRSAASEVRVAAIQALSTLGLSGYADTLTNELGAPEPEIRWEAATALGRLGASDAATRQLLAVLASDRNEVVQAASAYALARTVVPARQRDVVGALTGAAGPQNADSVRQAAAISLGQIAALLEPGSQSRAQAESVLRDLLAVASNSEGVQIAAAEALGGIQSGVEQLELAALSPSAGVRRAAVTSLGRIGTPQAIQVLLNSLKDEDPYVRAAARGAVDAADVRTEEIELGLADPSPAVRIAAVRKLAQVGRPEFIELLTRRLGDSDLNVREAAIEALTNLAPQSLDYVTDALDVGNLRLGAATVLANLDQLPPRAINELLSHAGDADPSARQQVARALSHAPPGVAVDALVAGTRDPDPGVRAQAALALAPQAAESNVRQRLEEIARADRSVEVRDAAIRSLSEGTRGFRQQEMKR